MSPKRPRNQVPAVAPQTAPAADGPHNVAPEPPDVSREHWFRIATAADLNEVAE